MEHPHVYVDADACPVKSEVTRVAERHDLPVTWVAGSHMRVPEGGRVRIEVVAQGFDAADDWIVEHVAAGDIVVTADIALASRCLAKGAAALGNTGAPFTEDTHTFNVSSGGLCFESRHNLPMGCRLALKIALPPALRAKFGGRSLYRVYAAVCRVERATEASSFRVGVRFLSEIA